ncbi:hypothetical protein LJB90_04085, partial [Eubacteriales bacterium OttesenSCG-928-G02]|nr:hypothetical protein [Eubacteriales bacterium OttesenSCG-928-G02]
PLVYTIMTEGEEKDVNSTSHSVLYVTVRIKGYISNDMFYTQKGIPLVLNRSVRIENKSLVFDAKLTDIKKVVENID